MPAQGQNRTLDYVGCLTPLGQFARPAENSGTAQISTDRAAIRRLYKRDWKVWFGELDSVRDGGPDDPRLALILVNADSVLYMKRDTPAPVVLFEVAKAMITGDRPGVGDVKRLDL